MLSILIQMYCKDHHTKKEIPLKKRTNHEKED